jgi:hypothetical protein
MQMVDIFKGFFLKGILHREHAFAKHYIKSEIQNAKNQKLVLIPK